MADVKLNPDSDEVGMRFKIIVISSGVKSLYKLSKVLVYTQIVLTPISKWRFPAID